MSPKKRKDLGKKGRDRIVKNFSMNMAVNDYINLIYEIINEKNKNIIVDDFEMNGKNLIKLV